MGLKVLKRLIDEETDPRQNDQDDTRNCFHRNENLRFKSFQLFSLSGVNKYHLLYIAQSSIDLYFFIKHFWPSDSSI